MPEEEYTWLARAGLLTFEEQAVLADAFLDSGVAKVRLTGGEPLLRRDLHVLVSMLSRRKLTDLALTTNALRLPEQAADLRAAGLRRLTISLDTLRPDRFRALTRRDELARTLEGIAAAASAGFTGTKLNTVVQRGVNDDELTDIVEFCVEREIEPRFIEYMDVGGATAWDPSLVVPREQILAALSASFGEVTPLPTERAAPARRFRLSSGATFGLIASTTRPFCGDCDRARLTADGRLFTCLYSRAGLDLARPLREGATREELAAIIQGRWREREDRGAEERLAVESRRPLAPREELASDPHLEMHTRGG